MGAASTSFASYLLLSSFCSHVPSSEFSKTTLLSTPKRKITRVGRVTARWLLKEKTRKVVNLNGFRCYFLLESAYLL